jgi:TPP-dependent pyruvate/acetoin dehydrogenase alpha subunit
VGTACALERGNFIAPLIRNVGAMLVQGFRPRDVFLQHLARADSPTGGCDANTHFGDLRRGVLAPISMLGETIPVCAGIALASKMRGEGRVAVASIGDGGASTGSFHEGLNFAAVRKLPLVVVAENKGWAYSTPVQKQMAVRHMADRAPGYGIPARSVDGNDVMAVYRAMRKAAGIARRGEGPFLLECGTLRMKGHAEHDDARYVPKEILEEWRKKDPIARFEKYLCAKQLMTTEEKAAVEERVENEICEGLAFAEASLLPAPERAAMPVWA